MAAPETLTFRKMPPEEWSIPYSPREKAVDLSSEPNTMLFSRIREGQIAFRTLTDLQSGTTGPRALDITALVGQYKSSALITFAPLQGEDIPPRRNDNVGEFATAVCMGQMALNEIVLRNQGLVFKFVREIHWNPRSNPAFDSEDLINIGQLGLMQAAARFDPGQGVKFGGYAPIRIIGAIADFIRAASSNIRRHNKHMKAIDNEGFHFYQENGRWPIQAELASLTGLTAKQVRAALGTVITIVSIDAPEDVRGEGHQIYSQIPDRDWTGNPVLAVEFRDNVERLQAAIKMLKPRTRYIVHLYYLEELSMAEIGKKLGFSTSWVDQSLKKAIADLRKLMQEE